MTRETIQNNDGIWVSVINRLKGIPEPDWEVFKNAKTRAGFTRPWSGVRPGDPDLIHPYFLSPTETGDITIPTYTIALTEDEWHHASSEVALHTSAVMKLGKAILEKARTHKTDGDLPALDSLGFSEDEIEILLSRPDISDPFILSRTDYTMLIGTDTDNIKMYRYETNCSQPGGAEVIDSFSMPDAIRNESLPIVGETLDSFGINNHKILPAYVKGIKAFWQKYQGSKDIEGIMVLSGGYNFGTELLVEHLKESFQNSNIIPDNTAAPRPLSENRRHIKDAANEYADTIGVNFVLKDDKLFYIDKDGTPQEVNLVIHEPKIDIEHFAALNDSDLIKAWKLGIVEIVNPPQARVCGTKKLETIIADEGIWEEMDELGFGLTNEEKTTELRTTIPSFSLNDDIISQIGTDASDAYRRLVVKPSIAGSGRGIIMGRSYPDKGPFLEALAKAVIDEEDYIVMKEELPKENEISLHAPGVPTIITMTDINPYTVIIPTSNGSGPQILVPGAVSRAFLPLTEEEKTLAKDQGIKLNVLGPENNFRLKNGQSRQYMIAIGNVAVIP